MPSTKIINVTRDDDFESVFNAFEGTSAKEVIFILPKNSRFSKNAEHFMLVKEKAKELDKVVNIMSEDMNLKEFVEDLGFKFLEIKKAKPKKKLVKKHTPISAVSNSIDGIQATKINSEPAEEKEEVETEPSQQLIEEPEPIPMIEETELHEAEEPAMPPEENEEPAEAPQEEAPEAPTVEPLGEQQSTEIEKLWFGLAKTNKRLKEKVPADGNYVPKGSRKKKYMIFSTLAAAVAVIGLFTAYSKADVVLRPEKEPINFELEITASINVSEPDLINYVIPGQLISVEDRKSGVFQASGHDDVVKKSDGVIKITNDLTTNQILIATTRFESPSGKIYRIPETVTIPGNGSLEIEVVADRAGEDYSESKGTKLTLPGFKEANLAERYENIYAEAVSEIKGGFIGEAQLVTEEDYNKAKDSLTKKSLDFVLGQLKAKTSDLNLQDIHSIAELKEINSTADADDVSDEFNMEIVMEGRTMLVGPDHIKELINAYLNDLNMIDKLTAVTYEGAEFSEGQKEVTFRIKVDGQAAAEIDGDQIVNNLLGKDETEITAYIRQIKEIATARISLSPFWIKSVPKNKDRVNIKFEY